MLSLSEEIVIGALHLQHLFERHYRENVQTVKKQIIWSQQNRTI